VVHQKHLTSRVPPFNVTQSLEPIRIHRLHDMTSYWRSIVRWAYLVPFPRCTATSVANCFSHPANFVMGYRRYCWWILFRATGRTKIAAVHWNAPLLHYALASCGAVYCNWSCLWVCDSGRAGGVRTLLQPARAQCLRLSGRFFHFRIAFTIPRNSATFCFNPAGTTSVFIPRDSSWIRGVPGRQPRPRAVR